MTRPLGLLLLLGLICVACNLPPAPSSQPAPPEPQEPLDTSTPSPAPEPNTQVWFAPNMGSRDYTALFTQPELWVQARSRIDVFKFYTQNVFDAPCSICGGNTLKAFVEADAFRKLSAWDIAIAVEVGAVKEWGCSGAEEFRVAQEVIENIQANGGTVALLDMDEPYIGGELVANGRTCGLSMEQSANLTAQFIEQVKAAYPYILVGDTEPYPYFSARELQAWIMALEDRGLTLDHFHLDVDLERVKVEGQDVAADLESLSRFTQESRIPFGVIFTSNWKEAGSDQAYFDSTMAWLQEVKVAVGIPEHLIFQSWQGPSPSGTHQVPINLPEDDPKIYSHTRLILEGLAVYGR